jgi:GNAT superfamily N-acetyltransferase
MSETIERVRVESEPSGLQEEFVLSDGSVVEVRTVSVGDPDRLRAMLSRLSRETIYLRFHSPYPRVPEWALTLLAKADQHGGQSLVAVVGEEVVGHAMYAQLEEGEAEIAIVVEDGWQGLGIGKLLLFKLTEAARHKGVETFVCVSPGSNRRVPRLINSVFADAEYEMKDGMRLARVSLRTLRPMHAQT